MSKEKLKFKKKKEKEREKHEKLINKRLKNAKDLKAEKKRLLFESKSRRRQEPIVNKSVIKHKFEDSTLPMSQEREVEINEGCLKKNLETLKTMEQEFVDLENQRKEHKERMENVGKENPDNREQF